RLEDTQQQVDEVLSLQELKLYQHALHTSAPTAPQGVDILRLLHQHPRGYLFGHSIITCIKKVSAHAICCLCKYLQSANVSYFGHLKVWQFVRTFAFGCIFLPIKVFKLLFIMEMLKLIIT
ncbi:hypothetical protein EGW08_000108, partial [Elysia chlorotica]